MITTLEKYLLLEQLLLLEKFDLNLYYTQHKIPVFIQNYAKNKVDEIRNNTLPADIKNRIDGLEFWIAKAIRDDIFKKDSNTTEKIKKNEIIDDYYLNRNYNLKLIEILDYITSLNRNVNIDKVNIINSSFDEMYLAQKNWHNKLVATGFLDSDENGFIIKRFNDGYYWIDLQKNTCKVEGEVMGHCGASTNNDTLLSLRCKNKISGKISIHTTMSVDYFDKNDDNYTYKSYSQCKGKNNKPPIEEYYKYIVELFIDKDIFVDFNYKSGYRPELDFHTTDVNDIKLIDLIIDNRPELFIKTNILYIITNDYVYNKLSNMNLIENVKDEIYDGVSYSHYCQSHNIRYTDCLLYYVQLLKKGMLKIEDFDNIKPYDEMNIELVDNDYVLKFDIDAGTVCGQFAGGDVKVNDMEVYDIGVYDNEFSIIDKELDNKISKYILKCIYSELNEYYEDEFKDLDEEDIEISNKVEDYLLVYLTENSIDDINKKIGKILRDSDNIDINDSNVEEFHNFIRDKIERYETNETNETIEFDYAKFIVQKIFDDYEKVDNDNLIGTFNNMSDFINFYKNTSNSYQNSKNYIDLIGSNYNIINDINTDDDYIVDYVLPDNVSDYANYGSLYADNVDFKNDVNEYIDEQSVNDITIDYNIIKIVKDFYNKHK